MVAYMQCVVSTWTGRTKLPHCVTLVGGAGDGSGVWRVDRGVQEKQLPIGIDNQVIVHREGTQRRN